MEEFYIRTRDRDCNLFQIIAAAVNNPDHEMVFACVLYTAPTGQPYRFALKYVVRGMEKHMVFTPCVDSDPTFDDPCLEMALFLDLLLGTSFEYSIMDERNNPMQDF
jgi:hypothetical protein